MDARHQVANQVGPELGAAAKGTGELRLAEIDDLFRAFCRELDRPVVLQPCQEGVAGQAADIGPGHIPAQPQQREVVDQPVQCVLISARMGELGESLPSLTSSNQGGGLSPPKMRQLRLRVARVSVSWTTSCQPRRSNGSTATITRPRPNWARHATVSTVPSGVLNVAASSHPKGVRRSHANSYSACRPSVSDNCRSGRPLTCTQPAMLRIPGRPGQQRDLASLGQEGKVEALYPA